MAKNYTVAQLKEMAKKKKISGYSKLRKQELMDVLGLGGRRNVSPKHSPKSSTRYYYVPASPCPVSNLKKYANRPGPPRPANAVGCRNKTVRGNDGKWYQSVPNKNGVYRWVKN